MQLGTDEHASGGPIARMHRSVPPSAICAGIGIVLSNWMTATATRAIKGTKMCAKTETSTNSPSMARTNHRGVSGGFLKPKLRNFGGIPEKEKANLISQIGLYLCRQRPTLPHTWRVQYHRPCSVCLRSRVGMTRPLTTPILERSASASLKVNCGRCQHKQRPVWPLVPS